MDQIEWCLLGRTSHCACMRKDHPLAGRASISMIELRRSDFVAISPQYLPEYTDMLKGLCLPFGFTPNITNYVSSANSLTLNLHTDRDVFICDKYYADLNRGEHALVPIENTKSGFVMAWRRDNPKGYLRDFIDQVLQIVEE